MENQLIYTESSILRSI